MRRKAHHMFIHDNQVNGTSKYKEKPANLQAIRAQTTVVYWGSLEGANHPTVVYLSSKPGA